ncbi:MAG: hypothetical protein ACREJB_04545 [Planctomycetaceae bacterium]
MVTRHVRDLPADEKHALEHLLGEPLRDDQQVCVMVLPPDVVPDEKKRREAAQRLHRFLDDAERRAQELGITSEEADAAVEEAMRHVRRRG